MNMQKDAGAATWDCWRLEHLYKYTEIFKVHEMKRTKDELVYQICDYLGGKKTGVHTFVWS
jgi:hypothetical protein